VTAWDDFFDFLLTEHLLACFPLAGSIISVIQKKLSFGIER
jgi:hypothetical protein